MKMLRRAVLLTFLAPLALGFLYSPLARAESRYLKCQATKDMNGGRLPAARYQLSLEIGDLTDDWTAKRVILHGFYLNDNPEIPLTGKNFWYVTGFRGVSYRRGTLYSQTPGIDQAFLLLNDESNGLRASKLVVLLPALQLVTTCR